MSGSEAMISGGFVLTHELEEKLAIEYQGQYVREVLDRDYESLARTLGDDLKREFSEYLAQRFRHHKIKKSYSKEVYIMVAILLGMRFDEDILFPEAAMLLAKNEPCYLRMAALKAEILRKRDDVHGSQYQHYAHALARVVAQDEEQLLFLAQESKAVEKVLALFPERACSISKKQFSSLIDMCNTLSAKYFAKTEYSFGSIVLLAHMLMLGARCVDDPLHDYVRKILYNDNREKAVPLFRYGQKRAKGQLKLFDKFIAIEREAKNV